MKKKKVIVFDEMTGSFIEKEVEDDFWSYIEKEDDFWTYIEKEESFSWTCPLDDETKEAFGI